MDPSMMNAETGPFRIDGGDVGCVMIHGFTATPWCFRELGAYLAGAGYTVSAPLLPGHGLTPEALEACRWESWIDTALKEAQDLKRSTNSIFLLGHSIGGAVALLSADRFDAKGVILISTPVRPMDWRLRLLPIIRPFVRSWKKGRRSDLSKLPAGAEYDRYPLKGVAQLLVMLREVRKRIGNIQCPVLILHGRGDRRVSVKDADWIYDRIGSDIKEKIIIEDDRHLITMGSEKERVADEVRNFMDRYSFDP